MGASPPAPRPPRPQAPRSPTRTRFLQFLVGVAVLHVVAIALYYALDIPHAAIVRQRMFAWIWIGATVLVIFVGLQRIKRSRSTRG
jgi:uncharacterized membrane protein YdcZ (DUF606 family)